MAKLLSTERPVIEYELSTSTPEDKRWIKAYTRPEMEDLAAMRGNEAVYILVSRLIQEWSWEDIDGVAPITPENLRRIDPVDFIEICDQLEIDAFLNRIDAVSKKKNSFATSSPKASSPKVSQ